MTLVEPRYLAQAIATDSLRERKVAVVSGPRGVGKTTLARTLLEAPQNELRWEDPRFRARWARDPLGAVAEHGPGPVLLDEIHKDRRWQARLEALYDVRGRELPIMVTGSARLDPLPCDDDRLRGRARHYRLHPFSAGESTVPPAPVEILTRTEPRFPLDALLTLTGFPEPLLSGSATSAIAWSQQRAAELVVEDLRDLRHVHDIQAVRVLADLLPARVGSLLSVNALRDEVGVAYATVRDWLAVLEMLHHVVRIAPYAGPIGRALRAEPKLYLVDFLAVDSRSAKLENLTALHLLKACHYWTDVAFGQFGLRFLRTKEKDEVDFVVLRDGRPWMLVDCCSAELETAPALAKFARKLGTRRNVQLVDRRGHDRFYPEPAIRVMDYERFFAGLV